MADDGDGFGSQFTAPMVAGPGQSAPAVAREESPQNGGFFGGASLGFGPHYDAPDPAASALDQSAGLLNQRVQRANQIATNPLAQIFAPEQVQAAREFVPKAVEQLQAIEKQKAGIAAGRLEAANLGLAPGEVSDQATHEDRVIAAQDRALRGDLKAFQGLQARDPKAAEAIQDQVHSAVAANLTTAQAAFDKLSNAQGPGAYAAAVRELRQGGSIAGLEALGLKVPDKFEAFSAMKGREAEALRNARIGVDTIGQKLEARNTGQPMEEKEAKTYKGAWKTVYGDEIEGQPSRVGASGARMTIIDQYDDPRKLGRGAVLASPEQRKAIAEEVDKLVPKDEREKYRAFNRTYRLATTDAKGNKLPDGEVNTNPNVQQGMAEGLASMLRGGSGGANVGLLKIETSKRGFIQGLIDKIETEKGAAINELKGKDVNPYLSKLTQQQIRDVMDVLKQYNDKSVGERVGPAAERAGALGLNASDVGFAKGEGAAIDDAMERGRQAQIALDMRRHQSIGGGRGALLYGALTPANNAQSLPGGTEARNQLPGTGLQTPVQQATSPIPPASPQAPPGAGGLPSPGAAPGGSPPQPGGPNAPAVPPTGGLAPGRTGVPPNMPLNSPEALTAAANRTIQIESGFKPGSKTGSYAGLGQWSKEEMKRHGITDPDDVEQTRTALKADMQRRAAKLEKDGLPATAANVYLMHQQGEAGLEAHLRNPDAPAWENIRFGFKNDAIAKRAIWGNMTDTMKRDMGLRSIDDVGKVTSGDFTRLWEARYSGTDRELGGAAAGARVLAGGPPELYLGLNERTAPRHEPGVRVSPTSTADNAPKGKPSWRDMAAGLLLGRDAEEGSKIAVENAPAIGSTVGMVGGGLAGGPPGALAGGGIGGGLGQVAKDYLQDRPQQPLEIAKQTALGTVLGVAPGGSAARVATGVAARTLGAGAIEAGSKLAEGGDAVDAAEAGAKGLAYGLGGEALSRFVSMGGSAAYKALSRYTTSAQHELSASAGKLAEARQIMETEKPKLPGAAGAADTANPKFEAAKKQADDATTAIKDHGQNPDDMVHAYEQAEAGVSGGEAAVLRKAASEKAATSAGYNELRQDVRTAGVGTPKANQPLPDGPLSTIRTAINPAGSVEVKFTPDAEHAEMLIKAPAKDWGDKWQQLQNAGSELIQKRMAFLKNGDKPSADAMDEIFKGVRNQQKGAAEYVFGKKGGEAAIAKLENLDMRYAKIVNATQGMDYGKMRSIIQAGNTPERRALEKNFREFAGDDPAAMRAFNAMKAGAQGRLSEEARLMVPVIAGEFAANLHGVPSVGVVSALIGGHRLYKVMQQYANAKVLGKAVKFADFLSQEIRPDIARAAGNAPQRAVVQGQPLSAAAQ